MPAGVPQNLLAQADESIRGPSMIDADTYASLATFAEENDYGQALTLATQQSQTDMLKATPTQNVIYDTRSTQWTITAATDGLTTTNEVTANLASALCVRLNKTVIRGKMLVEIPATADARTYVWGPLSPATGITMGVQVGTNQQQIQDIGTTQDQPILLAMELMRKNTRACRVKCVTELAQASFAGGDYEYKTFVSTAATATNFTMEFELRPTSGLFTCEKVWNPSTPLRLRFQYSPTTLANILRPSDDNTTTPVISLQIYDVISDEVQLNPIITEHLQMAFTSAPATNMDLMLKSMMKGGPGRALFDETFGVGSSFDITKVAAIHQFPVGRVSTHSVQGGSFDIYPVMNGSARPVMIDICVFAPFTLSSKVYSNTLFAKQVLDNLQVLYDGRTVWSKPLTAFQTYTQSVKSVNAGYVTDKALYPTYAEWQDGFAHIVIKTGPSHNDEDIQPARATQLELRGTYSAATYPSAFEIRVGLFYDQTLLTLKNNTCVATLPIQ